MISHNCYNGKWHELNRCEDCGHLFEYGLVCPECGKERDVLQGATASARWVSTSVWWKPWTWGSGRWETR